MTTTTHDSLLVTLARGYEQRLAAGDEEAARLALEVLIREAEERLRRMPAEVRGG